MYVFNRSSNRGVVNRLSRGLVVINSLNSEERPIFFSFHFFNYTGVECVFIN